MCIRDRGNAFAQVSKRNLAGKGAYFMVSAQKLTPSEAVESGFFIESLRKSALKHNFGIFDCSGIVSLLNKFISGKTTDLPAKSIDELSPMTTELKQLLPSLNDHTPVFLGKMQEISNQDAQPYRKTVKEIIAQ